jgi:pyrroloquinoline quinone (PQQ) biosynthesis protein C
VEHLQHNLLEELGIEEEGGESHPALMEKLVAGAGLEDRVEELRSRARARLDEQVQQPILYGSLREIGLSALVEIVSFEYMLSRVSDRVAEFLMKYRDISEADLVWFTHHSVVDIEHAEQGLDAIADFIEYYAFDDEEAKDIITSTFRENVFIKRYFGVAAAARSRGMDR